MRPILELASTALDIRRAIDQFNREISTWSRATQLIRSTSFWVFDAQSRRFGPSKFVGFKALTSSSYDAALKGNRTGAGFNGALTKKRIEQTLNANFRANSAQAVQLTSWARRALGRAVVDGVNPSKWKFVTIHPGAPASKGTMSRQPKASPGTGGEWATAERSNGSPVGVTYRAAREHATTSRQAPFEVDPNEIDRGTRAHARLQNHLAKFLRARGIEPRSPAVEDPDADLLWQTADFIGVAEIKSTTNANSEKQLRLGLGQVLRYRQALAQRGHRVLVVLAVEAEPSASWQSLGKDLGVVVVSPIGFERILAATPQHDRP